MESGADKLESHTLLELPVRALRQIHDAHPAATELTNDPIHTDGTPGLGIVRQLCQCARDDVRRNRVQEPMALFMGLQERLDFRPQRGIAFTRMLQDRRALGGRALSSSGEDLGHALCKVARWYAAIAHLRRRLAVLGEEALSSHASLPLGMGGASEGGARLRAAELAKEPCSRERPIRLDCAGTDA